MKLKDKININGTVYTASEFVKEFPSVNAKGTANSSTTTFVNAPNVHIVSNNMDHYVKLIPNLFLIIEDNFKYTNFNNTVVSTNLNLQAHAPLELYSPINQLMDKNGNLIYDSQGVPVYYSLCIDYIAYKDQFNNYYEYGAFDYYSDKKRSGLPDICLDTIFIYVGKDSRESKYIKISSRESLDINAVREFFKYHLIYKPEGDFSWMLPSLCLYDFEIEDDTNTVRNLIATYSDVDNKAARKQEWYKYQTKLLNTAINIEETINFLKDTYGNPPKKLLLILGVPVANEGQTNWNSNISELDSDSCINVTKEFIDSTLTQFDSYNFKNIEINGFYFINEELKGGLIEYMKEIVSYVHDTYRLNYYWAPYRTASGLKYWRYVNFDSMTVLPNYSISRINWPTWYLKYNNTWYKTYKDSENNLYVKLNNLLYKIISYDSKQPDNYVYFISNWDLLTRLVEDSVLVSENIVTTDMFYGYGSGRLRQQLVKQAEYAMFDDHGLVLEFDNLVFYMNSDDDPRVDGTRSYIYRINDTIDTYEEYGLWDKNIPVMYYDGNYLFYKILSGIYKDQSNSSKELNYISEDTWRGTASSYEHNNISGEDLLKIEDIMNRICQKIVSRK